MARVIGRSQETRHVYDDAHLADARAGMSVRVRADYRKPHRRGAVGTVKKRYGNGDYTVLEVSFPDGRTDLFWGHQLEVAKKGPIRRRAKRRWIFW